jgi:uncharacterized protein (DUF983 family)
MFCQKCAAPNLENAVYCRSCGFQIGGPDPSKLNGYAIAKFLVGDVFVLPAVLLVALESSVQSMLWVLLAVPGLILYTWAIVDLVNVRAAKRQRKETASGANPRELGEPIVNTMPGDFTNHRRPVSVIEHTTGNLR